jgi:hypothetical protein
LITPDDVGFLAFLQFTREIALMASVAVRWGPVADGLQLDRLRRKGFAGSESSLSVKRELSAGADAKLRSGEVDPGVFKHNHIDATVEF